MVNTYTYLSPSVVVVSSWSCLGLALVLPWCPVLCSEWRYEAVDGDSFFLWVCSGYRKKYLPEIPVTVFQEQAVFGGGGKGIYLHLRRWGSSSVFFCSSYRASFS